jgi:hypothetical protein
MFNGASTEIGAAQLAPAAVLWWHTTGAAQPKDRGDKACDSQRHQRAPNALHQWG